MDQFDLLLLRRGLSHQRRRHGAAHAAAGRAGEGGEAAGHDLGATAGNLGEADGKIWKNVGKCRKMWKNGGKICENPLDFQLGNPKNDISIVDFPLSYGGS